MADTRRSLTALQTLLADNTSGAITAQSARDTLVSTYGGMVGPLEEHSASASATLDFTAFISSLFDTYIFVLGDILPATSTADLWIRMGTGGGPTWDSGANYTWSYFLTSQIPSSASLGGAGAAAIKMAHSLSNASTDGVSGAVTLYSPQSTTVYKRLMTQVANLDSGGNFVAAFSSGQYLSTTVVTGIRFLMSSGNIASGTIRVYGIAH